MDRFEHHHGMHGFGHHWPPPGGYGFDGPPQILLSTLNTLVWIVLFAALALLLLRWIIPYIIPLIVSIFSTAPANPPALEILRQRYAAGEIDAITFEHMRERLQASYQQEANLLPLSDNAYSREAWTGYRHTFSSPISRGQRSMRIAAQKRYSSEKLKEETLL